MEHKPISFDLVIRWIIGIALAVGAYFLLQRLSAVLLPFFLAWLTAYLMNPMVEWTQKLVKRRIWAVVSVVFVMAILMTGFLALMIPLIATEVKDLYELIDRQLTNIDWPAWLPKDVLDQAKVYLSGVDYTKVLEQEGMTEKLAATLSGMWGAISGVYGIVGALFGVVTYLLYTVFILLDYKEISTGWKVYVPEKYRPMVDRLLSDLEEGMNGYFRAQSKIVLVVSILFAVGFKSIGLPFGILLGILCGLLNYVPYLQIAGMIPALFLAVVHGLESDQSMWLSVSLVLVVFAIVQLAQDIYITPKFLGDFSGFNPAIILLSLSVWGSLMGMIGLIIAIPMTSLLLSYYRRFIIQKTNSHDS